MYNCLVVLFLFVGDVSESVSPNADRRRASSGLVSMPRIGRSDLTWTFQSQGWFWSTHWYDLLL